MKIGIRIAMNDPGIFTDHTGGTSSAGESGDTPLHYPEMPFSPELKAMLSTMPKGCAELAVHGSGVSPLGHEILRIILALPTWISLAKKLPELKTRILGGKSIQMDLQQSAHPIEGMMCVSILLYSIRATQDESFLVRTDSIILGQIRAFQNELRDESGTICKELQFWVALVGAEMGQMADAESCRAAHEPLDDMLRSKHWRSDWQSIRRILENFFWTAVLMEA
jgi:hypothetical protein